MTFLEPWSGLLAGAVVLPLLLLLYVLKLRRRMLRMPSTLLWRKATQDLQANVPFQRLRWSLLLLLQLLAAGALLAALARPVLQAPAETASRVILLVDRSASMNASQGDGTTRLDAVREAAKETVRRLGRRREPVQVMVVAFASAPQVMIGFESNRALLLNAIDAIEPTDEEADLATALDLAGVFARGDESAAEIPPEVVLLSDGGVAQPAAGAGFVLPAGTLRFVGVGPDAPDAVDNVGIVTASARRDYRNPGRVLVFARLVNAGPREVESTVTLRADARPSEVAGVTLPPAGDGGPGESAVSFALDIEQGAVLTLSVGRRDDLAADDVAAIVLQPPRAPRLALVYAGEALDPFLVGLLEALQPEGLVQFAAGAGAAPAFGAGEFDAVVFDGACPGPLPDAARLFFGCAPPGLQEVSPRRPGGNRILSWDRQNPILRNVSLDAMVYTDFGGYVLPEGWTALAWGPDGPVIAAGPGSAPRSIAVGFRLSRSNWPRQVSVAVFVQNALDYLTMSGEGGASLAVRPGEPVTVRAAPGVRRVELGGPVAAAIDVRPDGTAALPPLTRAGLYAVGGALPPMDRIAVNVESDVESDIRPRRTLTVNAERTEAAASDAAAPLELWPILAAAAFVLLVLEWIVYCARARG